MTMNDKDIPVTFFFRFRSVLPDLLDAHVFGQCGYRLDGTRSIDNGFSPGKALMDLGYSEALVDRKRLLHAGSRTSSESLLLRILMATNDVDDILDDFGVSDTTQSFFVVVSIFSILSDRSTATEEEPK